MAGYILRDGEKSVVLRADQIDRLLGRGDGDAALLYLCLLRNDGAIEPQRLMQSLRFSELRLRAAETALQELGLIDRPVRPQPQEPAQEPVTANPSVTLPDSSAVFPGEQSHQPQPTPEPAAQPDDPQPKKDAETAAPAQPREVVYTWPVKGQVLRGFTVEALAYDETMGDWRTHGGIDIAAEEGRKVLAAGEGQVAEVYDDAMMGTTVTVLQADGVTAVYSNLAQETAVAVGDLVDTGAVLGEVGRTALAESGLEPHLHLELLADGEPVNPLAYLPKLN